MSEIKVIPYMRIDGVPNFRDSQIMEFYDRMEADGTLDHVTCRKQVMSRETWANVVLNSVLLVAFRDGRAVGIAIINGFEGTFARGHFCLFSEAWGKGSVEIGKALLDASFKLEDCDGEPISGFLALLPSANRQAVEFLIKCGGVFIGEMPFGWLFGGKPSPAAIGYFERKGE